MYSVLIVGYEKVTFFAVLFSLSFVPSKTTCSGLISILSYVMKGTA